MYENPPAVYKSASNHIDERDVLYFLFPHKALQMDALLQIQQHPLHYQVSLMFQSTIDSNPDKP